MNTGEAVVELDATSESTAIVVGDMVNTASRLQSAAPPGGVLVGEETYRITHRAISYEDVEPIIAKNKRDPVPVWLAIEPISGFAQRPSETPFLGRENELDLLDDVWGRATSGRRAHLVTILGEPGDRQESPRAGTGATAWRRRAGGRSRCGSSPTRRAQATRRSASW